jgi:HEAT repeat protein
MRHADTLHAVPRRRKVPSRALWKTVVPLVLLAAGACATTKPRPVGKDVPRPVASTTAERRAVTLIRSQFGSNDVKKWMTARRELATIGRPAVPFLMYAMYTGDSVLKRNCLETLVSVGLPATDALSVALDAKDRDLRRNATIALGRIGSGAPRLKLRSLAAGDPDWMIRAAASEALGRVRDRKAAPTLINVLSDSEAGVREWAAWSLGRLGDPVAVPPLEKLMLKDASPEVREAAKKALRVLTQKTSGVGA